MAAGVIGLTVEHLQALGTPRVDIIYICSNQAIARQNVNRLKHLLGIEAKPLASRITLLPYRLTALENPVKPDCADSGNIFGSASAEGVIKERIILYRLLRGAWGEAVRHRRLVFLGGLQSVSRFQDYEGWYRDRRIDPGIVKRFRESIGHHGRLCMMNLSIRRCAREQSEPGDTGRTVAGSSRTCEASWPKSA